MSKWVAALPIVVAGVGVAGIGGAIAKKPKAETCLSTFVTSLRGRTPAQVHNATLSVSALNGKMIAPGEVFSFNKRVGTWTRDQGYRKAPVSYDGQLVSAWGGGVCQTSSTFYNAALLAGLDLVERCRHQFAPGYLPPGRDAAVAFGLIDLKVRNPYRSPIRISAKIADERLVVQLLAAGIPKPSITVTEDLREVTSPGEFSVVGSDGRRRIRNSGKPGFDVIVWRTSPKGREMVSHDHYPVMNRIIESP